nr:hypothetical protein CFP56_13755 [Quercus suber]
MSLVLATNCTSLDLPSSCRLLNQFGEIFMDPNFCGGSDYLGGCELILPRIPKGFKLKHQSVGNSVSFRVGREFKKLVLCFAFQSVLKNGTEATCFVDSTNGFSEEKKIFLDEVEGGSEHLFLSPIDLLEWEESNPSEENLLTIKVKFKYGETIPSSSDDPIITWLGVHVDCICCGRGSSSVSDDIVSVSDDIDHHPFPSDAGLQLDTNLLKFHPDLDHGVFNNGGVSGHLIEPNFESTFPGDVLDSHDSDSSSFVNPFASIGYNDLHDSDLSSFVNPSASIGYNDSDAGEHWLLRFLKTPPFTIIFLCFR